MDGTNKRTELYKPQFHSFITLLTAVSSLALMIFAVLLLAPGIVSGMHPAGSAYLDVPLAQNRLQMHAAVLGIAVFALFIFFRFTLKGRIKISRPEWYNPTRLTSIHPFCHGYSTDVDCDMQRL